jgi:hypothetical protein
VAGQASTGQHLNLVHCALHLARPFHRDRSGLGYRRQREHARRKARIEHLIFQGPEQHFDDHRLHVDGVHDVRLAFLVPRDVGILLQLHVETLEPHGLDHAHLLLRVVRNGVAAATVAVGILRPRIGARAMRSGELDAELARQQVQLLAVGDANKLRQFFFHRRQLHVALEFPVHQRHLDQKEAAILQVCPGVG